MRKFDRPLEFPFVGMSRLSADEAVGPLDARFRFGLRRVSERTLNLRGLAGRGGAQPPEHRPSDGRLLF